MPSLEELKVFREELAEKRLNEVFRLTAYNEDRLELVAHIQGALDAIDAVIARGDLPSEEDGMSSYFAG